MMGQTGDRPLELTRVFRGRPRLDDAVALRSTVSVSLPTPIHDRLIAIANQQGISVSELARRLILSRQSSSS